MQHLHMARTGPNCRSVEDLLSPVDSNTRRTLTSDKSFENTCYTNNKMIKSERLLQHAQTNTTTRKFDGAAPSPFLTFGSLSVFSTFCNNPAEVAFAKADISCFGGRFTGGCCLARLACGTGGCSSSSQARFSLACGCVSTRLRLACGTGGCSSSSHTHTHTHTRAPILHTAAA